MKYPLLSIMLKILFRASGVDSFSLSGVRVFLQRELELGLVSMAGVELAGMVSCPNVSQNALISAGFLARVELAGMVLASPAELVQVFSSDSPWAGVAEAVEVVLVFSSAP